MLSGYVDDHFDESIFNANLFADTSKLSNRLIIGKGRIGDDLVVKKRAKTRLGEHLTKREKDALKKRLQMEKERKSLKDLEFLKRLSLDDHHIHLRPEHRKLLNIPKPVGMLDSENKSHYSSSIASKYLSPRSSFGQPMKTNRHSDENSGRCFSNVSV